MLWTIHNMLFAILDEQKMEPIPNTHARCPVCGGKVVSKCGEINVWHWAHLKDESCDTWYEPETRWHRNWKLTFGRENCEIKIVKDDSWHVADVLTLGKLIIELQNSSIAKNIIREREEFYGERMIWIINGIKFKENFYIKDWSNELNWWDQKHDNCKHRGGKKMFKWDYPRKSWEGSQRHVFIDFHDGSLFWVHEGMGRSSGVGKFVPKHDFINKYGGDFKKHLSLFRNCTFELKRNKVKLRGIKENNIHLIASVKYKGVARSIEIYFENEVDIFKIKKSSKFIVNGSLRFEDSNRNLELINSHFLEQ